MSDQATSVLDCAAGQEFYRCAIGPFIGCCASNPCDTGVCPDSDDCNGSDAAHSSTALLLSSLHIVASTVAYGGLLPTNMVTVTRTSAVDTQTKTALGATTAHTNSVSEKVSSAVTHSESAHVSGAQGSAPPTAIHTSTSSSLFSRPTSISASLTSLHHGPSAAAVIGGIIAALAVLVAVLILWCCCSKRAKVSVNRTKEIKLQIRRQTEKERRAQEAQEEQERVLAEREQALRALEGRGRVGYVEGEQTDEVREKHQVWI